MVYCIVYSLWKHKVEKFLRVDVVKIISETFSRIGIPVMTVDELLEKVKTDKDVWNLYWNGITIGLNQVEREKSTERCKRYKPKNVEELTGFIAGIRPGFVSMLETFLSRTPFKYGIPALDNLLKTEAIPDSFLEYDEQLLVVLKAAGIPGPDAYAAIKAVKKKKADKVASYKERFKYGFAKYLEETEGASKETALEVVEQIWTIMENSANYLFCSAHAFSMACDSLYVAWLKAHYPYELYVTMLKLYDEKKNKDKIAQIVLEMKRYKGISLISGQFGQDNRDWFVDKENDTISQSISSIRFLNKEAAEELYQLGLKQEAEMGVVSHSAVFNSEVKKEVGSIKRKLKKLKAIYETEENPAMSEEELETLKQEKDLAVKEGTELETRLKEIINNSSSYESQAYEEHIEAKLDCFTNVLRAIQMNTSVNTRMIEVLIGIGYFSKFGKTGKLMKVFDEYFESKRCISKTIKSFQERLNVLREYEASLPDEELPIGLRLQTEYENVGLCLSADPGLPSNLYFVESVDDKYSIRAKLYSVQRGTSGIVRISKKQQQNDPIIAGQLLQMNEHNMRDKCTYKNGVRTPIPGEKDCWMTKYTIVHLQQPSAA